jgi:hypothetical protein
VGACGHREGRGQSVARIRLLAVRTTMHRHEPCRARSTSSRLPDRVCRQLAAPSSSLCRVTHRTCPRRVAPWPAVRPAPRRWPRDCGRCAAGAAATASPRARLPSSFSPRGPTSPYNLRLAAEAASLGTGSSRASTVSGFRRRCLDLAHRGRGVDPACARAMHSSRTDSLCSRFRTICTLFSARARVSPSMLQDACTRTAPRRFPSLVPPRRRQTEHPFLSLGPARWTGALCLAAPGPSFSPRESTSVHQRPPLEVPPPTSLLIPCPRRSLAAPQRPPSVFAHSTSLDGNPTAQPVPLSAHGARPHSIPLAPSNPGGACAPRARPRVGLPPLLPAHAAEDSRRRNARPVLAPSDHVSRRVVFRITPRSCEG